MIFKEIIVFIKSLIILLRIPLMSAGLIALLSSILSLIISITDSIVNNYGTCKIDINNNKKELSVKGGKSLLITLSNNNIFIPSACGGRGSCAMCKCKIKSDVGQILPTELPYLSDEEKKENVRLSCQVKVKKDIKLEIPDELFYVKQFEGKIVSIIDLTHDIKEIKVKLIKPDNIDFIAGQYLQLEIPPYEKIKESTQRAYSMSGLPSDKNHVEFIIRLVPNGIVTTYVHNFLKISDKVKLIGPFGDFKKSDTEADMICVAGGSGMAPFKSMLYEINESNYNKRNIWYFFGARTLKDLFYLEELKKLEKEIPNFHFVPALSEPLKEDNWKGETGLITDVMDKYLKNKIDQNTEKEGYLCGSPGMIEACIRVMTANKIKEEKIYFDKFA